MYTFVMAYCGTGNNSAIRKLVHVAVSDVNDDVRRAAVAVMGLLLEVVQSGGKNLEICVMKEGAKMRTMDLPEIEKVGGPGTPTTRAVSRPGSWTSPRPTSTSSNLLGRLLRTLLQGSSNAWQSLVSLWTCC
jgi:hypothetical protein